MTGIIVLTLALSFLYNKSIKDEFDTQIHLLSSSLMSEKKRFLRNAVERTIRYIEFERMHAKIEYAGSGKTDEQIEDICLERIVGTIRGMRLIDDGYIWINQIENYEGGDNYAIRRVHPNLPHTEGMWLSTNTTDINGNRPYEEELEGIKKNGELFFEYYFKKMHSDAIAHKMSFAKLYKPYNWVVATGIYLDDLDRLIDDEKQKMQASYDIHRMVAFAVSFPVILFSFLIIFTFEKHMTKLLSAYEGEICAYTDTLEELSNTDALTGLFNRLKLDEVFSYEISKAQRYQKAFSILLLDLDRFKSVNDTFGHQAGDQVLIETAAVLRRRCRKTDTIGRWGGEEFLIILPETDLESARLLADKIRQAVAEHSFQHTKKVTCSIGVCTFRENDDPRSMLERVDRALYLAKQSGRDRVESG